MAFRSGTAAIVLGIVGAVLLAVFYGLAFAQDVPCQDTDGEATCKPPTAPMALYYIGVAALLGAGVLAILHRRAHRHPVDQSSRGG